MGGGSESIAVEWKTIGAKRVDRNDHDILWMRLSCGGEGATAKKGSKKKSHDGAIVTVFSFSSIPYGDFLSNQSRKRRLLSTAAPFLCFAGRLRRCGQEGGT